MKKVKTTIICLFCLIFFNGISYAQIKFVDSGQNIGSDENMSIKLGDLDNDGDLDVVEGANNAVCRIRLNDGTGKFIFRQTIVGCGIALGDLDNDGDLDLFCVNYDTAMANEVWLNNGSGYFTNTNQQLGKRDSRGIALGDLDGDGDLDAFVANHINSTTLLEGGNQVWFNDGTGKFTDSGQELGNDMGNSVTLGDIDNDGDLDALVANNTYRSHKHEVWVNDGKGIFTISNQSLTQIFSWGILLGDLDNDNDLDIFIIQNDYSTSQNGNKILFNDGNGIFNISGQALGYKKSEGACLGDIDNDGDLDVITVIAGNGPDEVWLNDNYGVFTNSGLNLNIAASYVVELGDLDGDNDLDAYVGCYGANKVLFNITNQNTEVKTGNLVPSKIKLEQNYPNPFNPTTVISYKLPVAGNVKLSIYNLLGQKVKTLIDTYQNAGEHSIVWDGMNDSFNPVPSGVYIYKMEANGNGLPKKMILIK